MDKKLIKNKQQMPRDEKRFLPKAKERPLLETEEQPLLEAKERPLLETEERPLLETEERPLLEEKRLRRNLALIKSVADRAGVEIILAFKAFALWKTFPIFREYINSTTASSLSEALMAYHKFGRPAHTYSPAYTDDEIGEIARCSSHLTFNSLSQYGRSAHSPA